jgi:hypothetical protein
MYSCVVVCLDVGAHEAHCSHSLRRKELGSCLSECIEKCVLTVMQRTQLGVERHALHWKYPNYWIINIGKYTVGISECQSLCVNINVKTNLLL